MSEPRRWRPMAAADLRIIEQAVMQAVDAWLLEWVAAPCVASAQTVLIDPSARAEPFKHDNAWSLGASVRFTIRPNAWDTLLRRVLNLSPGVLLADDRLPASLLDPIQEELQSDLLQRLIQALSLQPAMPMPLVRAYTPEHEAPEKIQLTCLLDEHPLFDLRLAEPWRWLTLPAAHTTKAAISLEKRQRALADARLTVTALLGRCELSLAELGSLAVGDVITTRQPLSAPLEITLLEAGDRPGHVFALGQPGLTQGRASVQITSIQETLP